MSEFKEKVVLVTGGAQGIGLACIREFLINGVKGVTLIDFDTEKGKESTKLLNEEFGEGKVIFLAVDVSNSAQFEDAFKQSFNHWKKLDIVLNNAGIMSDGKWESTILTNCKGTLQGTLLGFEYMSKNQKGRGGVIINIGSSAGITPFCPLPIYSATKSFIVSLSRSLGSAIYFGHNGVKVLTVCPGPTATEIMTRNLNVFITSLCPDILEVMMEEIEGKTPQTTEEFAQNLLTVIKNGQNGTVWLIARNQSTEIDFVPLDKQCKL